MSRQKDETGFYQVHYFYYLPQNHSFYLLIFIILSTSMSGCPRSKSVFQKISRHLFLINFLSTFTIKNLSKIFAFSSIFFSTNIVGLKTFFFYWHRLCLKLIFFISLNQFSEKKLFEVCFSSSCWSQVCQWFMESQ